MRTLMHYVPRRYASDIIEALALGGGLDPAASRSARAESLTSVVTRLDAADADARWSARVTEDGGYHFERLWRGVTDHHVVEAAFLVSAEAQAPRARGGAGRKLPAAVEAGPVQGGGRRRSRGGSRRRGQ